MQKYNTEVWHEQWLRGANDVQTIAESTLSTMPLIGSTCVDMHLQWQHAYEGLTTVESRNPLQSATLSRKYIVALPSNAATSSLVGQSRVGFCMIL